MFALQLKTPSLLTACTASPSSPKGPPYELRLFTIANADFLYKIANEDKWTRL